MKPNHAQRGLIAQRRKIIDRLRNSDPLLARQVEDIRLPWYHIKNVVSGSEEDTTDNTEVFIYDEIGGLCGIPADQFVQELNDITTANISVRINSPGGSLFDSIAIYNALVKHPATVTCYIDAIAASGASIIAMAGDEVVMMVGSQLMIHDALGFELGNAAAFREMAEFLDKQSDNIATVYAAKGNPDTDWRALMLAETWMFAQEAIDLGLADTIYTKPAGKPTILPAEPPTEDPTTPPADPSEEDGTEEIETSIDSDLENLMCMPHRLTNRGYKYNGRRRAPAPPSADNWSALVDMYTAKL